MEDQSTDERPQPVPWRDRLSILLIAGIAFGGLLCMAIVVMFLALNAK